MDGPPEDVNCPAQPTRRAGRLAKIVSWTAGIALPAATFWLLAKAGPGELAGVFSSARFTTLMLACALYAALSVSKAVRWRLVLGGGLRARDYYSASSVHNLFALVVPMGLGEFAFVYIFTTRHGLSTGRSLAALAVGRAFDTVAVLCLSGGAAAIVWGLWPLALVSAAALVGAGVLAGPASRLGARAARGLAALLGGPSGRSGEALGHFADGLDGGYASPRALAASVLSAALVSAVLAALAAAFVKDLAPSAAVAAGFLAPLGALIPVRGVADLGKFEAVWVAALAPWGVAPREAFVAGFAIHVATLAMAALVALVGWAIGAPGKPSSFGTPPQA